MSATTVQDLIEQVRVYHGRLEGLFSRVQGEASTERLQMVAEYLRRHQDHLQRALDELEDETESTILNTYFKYTPQDSPLDELGTVSLNGDTPVEEVVRRLLELDQRLVNWMRELGEKADAPSVQDFFRRLAEMEEEEKVRKTRETLAVTYEL